MYLRRENRKTEVHYSQLHKTQICVFHLFKFLTHHFYGKKHISSQEKGCFKVVLVFPYIKIEDEISSYEEHLSANPEVYFTKPRNDQNSKKAKN